MTVRIELRPRVTRGEEDRSRGGIGDGDRVGQDRLHPLVGRKGLSLPDADCREEPHLVGIDKIGGLGLHDFVQLVIEADRIGADRIELHAGGVDELGFRRVAAFRGRIERKDIGAVLDMLDRRRDVAVLDERPEEHKERVGARLHDEIAFGRKIAGVAGRHEEILSALAGVGAGHADVRDPAEIGIVHRPENPGRHLQDHGPSCKVETGEDVDGRRIGREEKGAGIHEVLGDAERLILLDPGFLQAVALSACNVSRPRHGSRLLLYPRTRRHEATQPPPSEEPHA